MKLMDREEQIWRGVNSDQSWAKHEAPVGGAINILKIAGTKVRRKGQKYRWGRQYKNDFDLYDAL
jgi:hypothetical protein